jgi:hypothetical protein
MAEEFDPEPQIYLAETTPEFLNYFVINSVRLEAYLSLKPRTNCIKKLGKWFRSTIC